MNFLAILQVLRGIGDEILAANKSVRDLNALRTRAPDLYRASNRFAIHGDKHGVIPNGRGGYGQDWPDFLGRSRLVGRIKCHTRIHLRPQVTIGILHPNLYLHSGLLTICLGRDLFDEAVILAVGTVSVSGDDAGLSRAEFGKIALINIQFNLQVVQIGHRYNIAFCTFVAHEAGGDELALLDIALEGCPIDGRLNNRVVELYLRIIKHALRLLYLCAQSVDLFLARADADQIIRLLQRIHLRDRAVVAGLRIIQRLLSHYPLLDEPLCTLERDLRVLQISPRLFDISLGLGDLLRARPVFEFRQMRFQVFEIASGLQHLRAIFVILETDQNLALLYGVALFDPNPCDFADHLRSEFNLVRRDDVARRVQDDVPLAAR